MNFRMPAALAALCLAAAGSAEPQTKSFSAAGQTLSGTFAFVINQVQPVPLAGRGMLTFFGEGGCISTDEFAFAALQGGPPEGQFYQTPGHCAWVRTGDREFVVSGVKMHFSARGQLIGFVKLRVQLKLHDDLERLTGSFTFDLVDTSGRVIYPGNGTFEAERMKVELP